MGGGGVLGRTVGAGEGGGVDGTALGEGGSVDGGGVDGTAVRGAGVNENDGEALALCEGDGETDGEADGSCVALTIAAPRRSRAARAIAAKIVNTVDQRSL